jgi:hypothetical protein
MAMSGGTGMRKGLTAYGDPEFSLFLRKAFIRAMGYTDEALERPIIGIADTGSDYNACHGTAPQLVEAIKRGVLGAGGLPMVFPTISLHESFAHPTSMYLRNLMAMETEEMMRAQPMDAVVAIGGCDKTIPAQLMAIASVDLPDRLQDWSVGPDGVLVRTGPDGGTTMRKSPLLRIDAAVLMKVPESRWLPADPTPAELQFALSRLAPRQRAVRAWMQGDPTPLRNLLRTVDMLVASAEDLFLISATSANEVDRRKALEVLRRDHAGSLFAAAIQEQAKPAP